MKPEAEAIRKNKVYCKDCKYYGFEELAGGEYCAGDESTLNKYNGEIIKYRDLSIDKNKKGLCKLYKPNLWKRIKDRMGAGKEKK